MTRNSLVGRATLALLVALDLGIGLTLAPALAAPPTGAPTRAAVRTSAPAPVFYDMYFTPKVEPNRIFLSADAGQYLKRLHWRGWGGDVTHARGLFISDCASCPPPAVRTAWVRMSHPRACPAEGTTAYRKVVVRLSEPSEGHDTTRFRIPTGCPPTD
ncbi:MAG: hypothetical protein ACXVWV_09765 [Nocardioides sp.]